MTDKRMIAFSEEVQALSPAGLKIFFLIAWRMETDNGEIDAPVKYLAIMSGKSAPAVRRTLKELQAANWIRIIKRQGPDRKYIFRYRIAPGLVRIIEVQTPQEGA